MMQVNLLPTREKSCPRCGEKDTSKFFNEKSRKDGLSCWCKACAQNNSTKWRLSNRAKWNQQSAEWKAAHPEQWREIYFRSTYHIEFTVEWTKQQGRCGGCGEVMLPTGHEPLSVSADHDHTCCSGPKSCGQCFRSLVHNQCNRVMGNAKDNTDLLRKLASYLERKKP